MWTEVAPLIGEPLALDLVNTQVRCRGGTVDLISTPDELRAWLALEGQRAGNLTSDEVAELGDADLADVHSVRDWVTSVIHAARDGTRPPEVALCGLNATLRSAPWVQELTWAGTALSAIGTRVGPAGTRLCGILADSLARMVADGSAPRVRECEEYRCVLLFLPRNPRRRWCNPTLCGNRARVTRYYHRHKLIASAEP